MKIRATNSTPESAQFAEQLRGIFVAAGWQADPVFYNTVGGVAIEPGTVIVVPNDRSPLGILVQRAFSAAGVELKAAIDSRVPQGQVSLIVGQKP